MLDPGGSAQREQQEASCLDCFWWHPRDRWFDKPESTPTLITIDEDDLKRHRPLASAPSCRLDSVFLVPQPSRRRARVPERTSWCPAPPPLPRRRASTSRASCARTSPPGTTTGSAPVRAARWAAAAPRGPRGATGASSSWRGSEDGREHSHVCLSYTGCFADWLLSRWHSSGSSSWFQQVSV